MTELGRQDGPPLAVDLRTRDIGTWEDLWDALAEPCGLPDWFGRNLNAWWDTIETGAISDVLDSFNGLVLRVRPVGLFEPHNPEGQFFIARTNESRYASVKVDSDDDEPPPTPSPH